MRLRRPPNHRNDPTTARDSVLSRRAFLTWGSLTAAPDPSARPFALIANSLGNTLTVADARALEPLDTIKLGREPHKFRESLAGRSVYSCNVSSNEMIEIDLATLRPLRRIPILDPYNVTFTRNGRYLFKVAYRYTFVEVHDGHTFTRIKRLETGRQPSHFALSPDGRWFVNANQHSIECLSSTRRH